MYANVGLNRREGSKMPVPAVIAAAAGVALTEAAREGGGAAGRGLVGAAGRGLCNVHANNPNIVGSLGRLASDFVDGACDPYYNDNGITPPPSSTNPFSGGQCQGAIYEVSLEWETLAGTQTTTLSVFGPVSGTAVEPEAGGQVSVGVDARSFPGDPLFYSAGATQAEFGGTVKIIDVVRVDGQPDDCGDNPNQYDPSPDAPRVPSYGNPFEGEDFRGRPAPVIVFRPTFSPDVGINIPVSIDGNPLDFGDAPANPNQGKPEDRKPLIPGAPQTPEPGEDGICFDPVDGRILVGVSWTLTVPEGQVGGIPQASIPIYPRVVGNIRLLLGSCSAGTPETDVRISTARGAVFRSVGGTEVAGCVFNVLPGIAIQITPLYVEEDE